MSKEIAEKTTPNTALFDDDVLGDIRSLADAFDALSQNGIAVRDISEHYGTGFEVAEKDVLVGKPFVILQSAFYESDFDTQDGVFVTLYVVTEDQNKWIINDGSTGICAQMLRIAKREGITPGHKVVGPSALMVKRGLTRSEYTNEHGAGVTFYLNI